MALALTGMGASHPVFAGPRVAYLLLPSPGARAAALECEQTCFFLPNSWRIQCKPAGAAGGQGTGGSVVEETQGRCGHGPCSQCPSFLLSW